MAHQWSIIRFKAALTGRFMSPLSTPKLIARRLRDEWQLLLPILVGITVASSLVAAAPVYVDSLERLGMNVSIDRAPAGSLDIQTYSPYVPLTRSALDRSDRSLRNATDQNLSAIEAGTERHLKSDTFLVGLASRPLPETTAGTARVSKGYFQNLSNLDAHITVLQGRIFGDSVTQGLGGPIVEGVVGEQLARFFGLQPGDVVTFSPSLGHPTRVSVRIVGVIGPSDPSESYWRQSANQFLNPPPLSEPQQQRRLSVDAGEPPLAIFVSRETLIEGLGNAYPGSLIPSTWFTAVDRGALKGWSADEPDGRLDDFKAYIAETIPGATVISGIPGLFSDFERRSFFSKVPLLLLLTIMVATVLYYLSMMVSYLVERRADDVALLRSRGAGTLQLLRLYALEGLILTAIAVVVAPFAALGAVALSGKLPYFHEFTQGGFTPVQISAAPFLVAAGAGILCLSIFVIPGVIGARSGLIVHKMRASRPPSAPIFQRFYLDIGLLVIGGLVFWELTERGHLISGGLFEEVEVNEALLLAPILLLTVVALLFLRFFPLFVRYISGESPVFLHLLTAATVLALGSGIAARELTDENGAAWITPISLLGAFAAGYLASNYPRPFRLGAAGLVLQMVLVAAFGWLEPPASSDVLFAPTVALFSIVPLQVAFLLLRASTRFAPVWVWTALVHMARNPLQYGWMVLLLVLATGLGIVSTTVGGTLNRSQEEQVLYAVGADIRITGLSGNAVRDAMALKDQHLAIPGVTAASLAYRGEGRIGSAGRRFDVLALDSRDFHNVAWYRDDFSDQPLGAVMQALTPEVQTALTIPEGSTGLGAWVKPQERSPSLFLWLVVEDRRGVVTTLSLGGLKRTDWHLLTAELPANLQPPFSLLSIQLYEPGFGPVGTAGAIRLDDIHAIVGPDGVEQVLEDFEGPNGWVPLPTSELSDDAVITTSEDVSFGARAGLFTFGKDTDDGIRGIFYGPSDGRVPVVVSTRFAESTGAAIGDSLIADISDHQVPVVIRDTVDFFPTMSPRGTGFMLADVGALLRYLNMLSPVTRVTPNELFIKESPEASEEVLGRVYGLVGPGPRVQDRESQLESSRADPIIAAGWKAMIVLSLGIIVFTTGLGYIIYLLSFAYRIRSEMGFLQSLGLSRRQLAGLLGLEHLVIALIGLGLGSWAGFQMSRTMVSALAVTSTGQEVVPPFTLITDWGFLAPIYGVLVAVFLSALWILNRGVLRLKLHEVSRLES